MTKQNNYFSFQRLYLLCRQAFIENKKDLLIYIVGVSGAIILITMFLILMSTNGFRDLSRWRYENYLATFAVLYIGLGVLYNGMAFSAFRSKEKSLTYLMLPASSFEKFIFEFFTRIVLYVVGFPIVFWLLVNTLGSTLHNIYPDFINYHFDMISKLDEFDKWKTALIISPGLLLFTIPFVGASYFHKKTLIKTLFTLAIVLGAFALLAFTLFKGLNLGDYHPVNSRITFIRNQEDMIKFATLSAIVTNLSLLTVGYFKLKEKEV